MNDLEIKDLSFRYPRGEFTLEVPSLRVARDEAVVCIGPSGSGKTTLLYLMAGIYLPQRGRVAVDGIDWAARSDRERRAWRIRHIGLVFQEFELLDHLTVRENILLPYYVNPALALTGDPSRALAEETGLAGRLGRHPRELSHGERQRVAICRALATGPSLLLADEPTGNLDPDTTRRVVALLRAQARRHHAALVMVTHDHSLLDSFDRVVDLAELKR